MESTEIVKANVNLVQSVDDLSRIGKMMAASGYFIDAKEAAQASVKIMAGMEMGFGAFASMTGIYIIQGRPSVGANLMATAIKANPKYDYRVRELTDAVCRIEFFEIVSGKKESLGVSEFSAKDAEKAKVKNMGAFPRNMLFARAISNGIRWYCPDVFAGNPTYVPEELGAEVDADGLVISVPETEVKQRPAAEPEPEIIEGEVIPAEKPAKKPFDEEEYLRNFSQPANVMKMSYKSAATFKSEKTGQLYCEMSVRDLYCHWLGLAKKLDLTNDPNARDAISQKISAISAVLWHMKEERMLRKDEQPDPFA